MKATPAKPEPSWTVEGTDEPLSDEAIEALARLLVDLAEQGGQAESVEGGDDDR